MRRVVYFFVSAFMLSTLFFFIIYRKLSSVQKWSLTDELWRLRGNEGFICLLRLTVKKLLDWSDICQSKIW